MSLYGNNKDGFVVEYHSNGNVSREYYLENNEEKGRVKQFHQIFFYFSYYLS